ncbi:hypothetical protein H5410_061065 [Solanum commersonii]|uniref:Reverse transcriptase n=1 Tax=Solanum commersonii TaxID=4109 RepID=A0A9J5W6P5_SOLCO|nr:hypothetical protein H5410_061065 [Solanum commersonii]
MASCIEVTKMKVNDVLCSIGNDKAPGVDGLARRVQLVKTVIFGIQAYWAQLFVIPTKVMKAIQAYCRSFIWSGVNSITNKALVSREKMCTPKVARGLNLVNLRVWNKAAILKMCWDIEKKQDRLWIKWIHSYYING